MSHVATYVHHNVLNIVKSTTLEYTYVCSFVECTYIRTHIYLCSYVYKATDSMIASDV